MEFRLTVTAVRWFETMNHPAIHRSASRVAILEDDKYDEVTGKYTPMRLGLPDPKSYYYSLHTRADKPLHEAYQYIRPGDWIMSVTYPGGEFRRWVLTPAAFAKLYGKG